MMNYPKKTSWRALVAASILMTGGATLSLPMTLGAEEASALEQGKDLAFDRKKGNCLACHMTGDGVAPGDIGPPLVGMKQRYPDMAKLRAQIYDATQANPASRMPPFGKHMILNDAEIDKITEYVYSL